MMTEVGSAALARAGVPGRITGRVPDRWRANVPALHGPLTTGKWLFCFSSPAAKMPWTIATGDDAVVGTKVPSTAADSSKGTGTTQPQKSTPASSSNISDAGNARSGALINKPLPKFAIKKLSVIRSFA